MQTKASEIAKQQAFNNDRANINESRKINLIHNADNLAICSCWMCGNQRKYRGIKTLQEIRADDTRQQLDEYFEEQELEEFDEDFYENSIGNALFLLLNGDTEQAIEVFDNAQNHLKRSLIGINNEKE